MNVVRQAQYLFGSDTATQTLTGATEIPSVALNVTGSDQVGFEVNYTATNSANKLLIRVYFYTPTTSLEATNWENATSFPLASYSIQTSQATVSGVTTTYPQRYEYTNTGNFYINNPVMGRIMKVTIAETVVGGGAGTVKMKLIVNEPPSA